MQEPRLYITTVATDERFYYPYLVESCRRNGTELIVLGMGEAWQGYTWKMTKLREFLASVQPDDVVCFVDAYDVLCIRNVSDLVSTFEEIRAREGCRIVMGHEDTHIVGEIAGQIFFGSCQGKRLNAGSYIGRAADLLDIVSASQARDPGHHDDQILMTELCQIRPTDFYIDVRKEIFHISSSSLYEIYPPSSSSPFFIHGNACSFMHEMVRKQGMEPRDGIKKELLFYLVEKLLHHWFVFLYTYWLIPVVYIVVLVWLLSLSGGRQRVRKFASVMLPFVVALPFLPFLLCFVYLVCSDYFR